MGAVEGRAASDRERQAVIRWLRWKWHKLTCRPRRRVGGPLYRQNGDGYLQCEACGKRLPLW